MAGLRGSIERGPLQIVRIADRAFRVERIEDGSVYSLRSGRTLYRSQRHATEPEFLFLVLRRGEPYRPVELGRLWLTDAGGPLRAADRKPAGHRHAYAGGR